METISVSDLARKMNLKASEIIGKLMSMGMMMLPPVQISMPFKLMLFVLVDGWGLLIQSLFNSVL